MSGKSLLCLSLCVGLAACSGVISGGPKDGGLPTSTNPNPGGKGTLQIQPSTVALTLQGGSSATAQLHAVLVEGGQAQPVSVGWSSSDFGVAGVDTNGLVTAQGPRGGSIIITANFANQKATAQVTVVSQQVAYSGSSASGAAGLFNSPGVTDPQKSPTMIYPYDATVIPVNLSPMNFQWKPGAGNDLFRLTFVGPYAQLTAYVSPANPAQPSWQPDSATWSAFAQSNIGAKVTIDLEGVSSAAPGVVYGTAQHGLTLAASRFAGTIYYWSISTGAVLRISANSVTPQSIYTPPVNPTPGTAQCIACHAVSKDGTKMSAELWEAYLPDAGTILDLTQINSSSGATVSARVIVDGGIWSWNTSTFDNTGNYLMTTWNGSMTLRDSSTGAPVPAGSTEENMGAIGCGQTGQCAYPNWSPDGRSLYFARGVAGNPANFYDELDFSKTDLVESTWDATSLTFDAPTTLVPYDYDGEQLANFYATTSSDSSLVAFNRGPCARSDAKGCPIYCDGGTDMHCMPAGLRLVAASGGTPVELTQAEGPDNRNWFPSFSPFKEGGYHWLAFYSERDYGWVTAGQSKHQLWVTAIDDSPNGTTDPSHPAFWLPGQDSTTDNNKAQWAPLPCAGDGGTCQGDIDCCGSLVCRMQASGNSACVAAPQACVYVGGSCSQDSDCCTGLSCWSNLCEAGLN